jgi:RNA polymerase sigma-70 factor, ECF subfamily
MRGGRFHFFASAGTFFTSVSNTVRAARGNQASSQRREPKASGGRRRGWGPRRKVEEVDDRELLERVRRGDRQAFSELYALHQSAIYRYAAHMCGAAAADDLVQDTFVALLGRPGRYDPARGPILGYLIGIARHFVAKRLAARRSESLESTDALDEAPDGAPEAPAETPLDALSREELVAQVRDAIQSLPLPYREAVVLCELQEMDYAAAAVVMQCPIGTVRSRLHRARALLTAKLADRQNAAAIVTRPAR